MGTIVASQQVIFNLHVAMVLADQSTKILRTLQHWRCLWERALRSLSDDERMKFGVANIVSGLECLTRKIVETAVSDEANFSLYLRRAPSHGTKELHEFIKVFVKG